MKEPKPMIEVSVIVPIYNEEAILMSMASQLAPHLDRIAGHGAWQFVLVDNGSQDRSSEICDEIAQKWPTSIKVQLNRPDYGEALFRGLMNASGQWAFIINVDFWDVPFMRWCYHTRGTYDLVMGSKRADQALNDQSNYRRLLSWGLNSILHAVFGFVGSDTHGQKFLHIPTLRPIFEQCVMRRGQFDTEFALRASRAQLWLAEVPVPIVELRKARNLMLHKILRNIVDICRLYHAMKTIQITSAMRYHRWSREDVLNIDGARTSLFIEFSRKLRLHV
jgi:glycosyltransferase involved in cell wall biosynthesis